MAEFFNRKEEVLDVQLTPHGKFLLSQGILKPVYYSFHDDDILYDIQYAGPTEAQNSIYDRIKSAVRPKAQYTRVGAETNLKKSVDMKMNSSYMDPYYNKEAISTKLKLDILPEGLGTSDPNTIEAPAWNINVFRTIISSSAPGYSGSAGTVPIPQLEIIHQLDTYVGIDEAFATEQFINFDGPPDAAAKMVLGQDKFTQQQGQPPQLFQVSDQYSDGTFLYENQKYVFVDMREKHATNRTENFDLEVFEIKFEKDKMGGTRKIITPLKFLPPIPEDRQLPPEQMVATPQHVEFYFDLNVDNEIEDRILCQVDFENKKKDIFADTLLEYDCVPYLTPDVIVPDVIEDDCP